MSKPANSGDTSLNLGDVTNKMYALLHDLPPADRVKVMNSVAQLFGDPPIAGSVATMDQQPASGTIGAHKTASGVTPQKYFVEKAPQNKGEMLAVAAKYREDHTGDHAHSLEDFAKFFTDARQNFDRHNFQRDMKNAQHQAQLFNTGTSMGQYQLSYYGQQYVNALPNRDALKKLRRPGRKAGKRKTASRAASK
jgi:hypothetical protein